jgi:sulfur carrier protein
MTLKIVLNGEPAEVTATRLDAVLDELGYEGAVVATALNGDFVPREARERVELTEDDHLEVVAPLKGG